jgi:hypothetical protein
MTFKPTLVAFLAFLALAIPAAAAEIPPEVKVVEDCVRKNFPEKSAKQSVRLASKDAGGDTRTLEADILWKRGEDDLSKVVARVQSPADERGTAFLMVEREGANDMFSYLPEMGRVRRITARSLSGSFLGTDFNYEDFEELQSASERASAEKLPDSTLDGRKVHVLSGTKSADTGSSYSKVVTYVDAESCVPLKTELYGASGEVVKEIQVRWSDVEKRGSRFVPMRAVLDDRANQTSTELVIEKIEMDIELKDHLFTQGALTRGH